MSTGVDQDVVDVVNAQQLVNVVSINEDQTVNQILIDLRSSPHIKTEPILAELYKSVRDLKIVDGINDCKKANKRCTRNKLFAEQFAYEQLKSEILLRQNVETLKLVLSKLFSETYYSARLEDIRVKKRQNPRYTAPPPMHGNVLTGKANDWAFEVITEVFMPMKKTTHSKYKNVVKYAEDILFWHDVIRDKIPDQLELPSKERQSHAPQAPSTYIKVAPTKIPSHSPTGVKRAGDFFSKLYANKDVKNIKGTNQHKLTTLAEDPILFAKVIFKLSVGTFYMPFMDILNNDKLVLHDRRRRVAAWGPKKSAFNQDKADYEDQMVERSQRMDELEHEKQQYQDQVESLQGEIGQLKAQVSQSTAVMRRMKQAMEQTVRRKNEFIRNALEEKQAVFDRLQSQLAAQQSDNGTGSSPEHRQQFVDALNEKERVIDRLKRQLAAQQDEIGHDSRPDQRRQQSLQEMLEEKQHDNECLQGEIAMLKREIEDLNRSWITRRKYEDVLERNAKLKRMLNRYIRDARAAHSNWEEQHTEQEQEKKASDVRDLEKEKVCGDLEERQASDVRNTSPDIQVQNIHIAARHDEMNDSSSDEEKEQEQEHEARDMRESSSDSSSSDDSDDKMDGRNSRRRKKVETLSSSSESEDSSSEQYGV